MDNLQKALLVHTIYIAPYTGVNAYGEAGYGTDMPVKCRVQDNIKKIRTASGSEVVSNTQIYVDGAVSVNDRITLADGRVPLVLRISPKEDAAGNLHHTVIYT